MVRVLAFLLLAFLRAMVALAEIPCVSPADAVLVIYGPPDGSLLGDIPGLEPKWMHVPAEHPLNRMRITCPSGKRVGLWIVSPVHVELEPMTIMGCEVGVVVGRDARFQGVKELTVKSARVGVCWQGAGGTIIETHIEATEVAIATSTHDIWIDESSTIAPDVILLNPDGACTCPGAV